MNQDTSTQEIVAEINQRIEQIWDKPPAEIKSLLEIKAPYRQAFNLAIYSYFDANALAGTLWVLRGNLKDGIPLDNLPTVAASIVRSHAKSCEAYGLPDTSALLEKVSNVMGKIKDREDFIEVLERLIVYLNRMGMAGWLDLLMPWKKLGDAFEKVLAEEKPKFLCG